MKKLKIIIQAVFLFGLMFPLLSFGAISGIIPRIDPGRIGREVSKELTPAKMHTETLAAKPKEVAKKAPLSMYKFVLKEIKLNGVKVYKVQELFPLYQKYLNKKISIQDLQDIAEAITVKYRNDGYILSRAIIPAQKIKDGVAIIQVAEGFIDKVYVEGKLTKGTRGLIYKYAEPLSAIKPLEMSKLERTVLLTNDLSGVEAKSVISPSKDVPMAADLTLLTEQKRFAGDVAFDNYGTRYLGPERITAELDVNSIFGTADQLGVRTVDTTSNNNMRFVQGYYQRPLGSSGLMLNLYADYTETHPGFILEPFELKGQSEEYRANLLYPLLRSRQTNLYLTADFDWLDSNTRTYLVDPAEYIFEDHMRSLRVGVQFDHADQMLGINAFNVVMSHGLPGMGASESDPEIPLSRPGGRSDYTKITGGVSRLQVLNNWFSVLIAGEGQYSWDPLLSAEEFGFGGREFGRGYDPSEITGDDGIAGKIELRLNLYPEWKVLNAAQFYVFYDAGEIWNTGDENNQWGSQNATSTGAGVRFNFTKHVYGEFEITKALTYPVQAELAAGNSGKNFREFFFITAKL